MDGWMDRWMDRWMDGWTNGWMDGWMDKWMDWWMYQQTHKWINGWIDWQINMKVSSYTCTMYMYTIIFTIMYIYSFVFILTYISQRMHLPWSLLKLRRGVTPWMIFSMLIITHVPVSMVTVHKLKGKKHWGVLKVLDAVSWLLLLWVHVCLSIYLSVHPVSMPCIYLSIYLSICQAIHLSIYLSYMYIHPQSFYPPIHLFIHSSIHLHVHVCVHLWSIPL